MMKRKQAQKEQELKQQQQKQQPPERPPSGARKKSRETGDSSMSGRNTGDLRSRDEAADAQRSARVEKLRVELPNMSILDLHRLLRIR